MKKYWEFIRESRDTKIHNTCEKYDIKNYTINDDGSIDVDGDVDLSKRGLERIPIKFIEVTGDFYCYENNLTSLEGCPETVGGDFNCSHNKLISLEGGPKKVGGDFECARNNLTSLKGSPKKVGDGFYCYYNNLTSLEGCPKEVSGYFSFHNNNLTSLEGGPERVGWHFNCTRNNLTSLVGFPLYFNTDKSVLTKNNPIHEIYKLFDDPKAIELMNDYGLINDEDMEVSYTILEEIFEALGKTPPQFEDIRLEHYTLIE